MTVSKKYFLTVFIALLFLHAVKAQPPTPADSSKTKLTIINGFEKIIKDTLTAKDNLPLQINMNMMELKTNSKPSHTDSTKTIIPQMEPLLKKEN
jgi:hypothetical protein